MVLFANAYDTLKVEVQTLVSTMPDHPKICCASLTILELRIDRRRPERQTGALAATLGGHAKMILIPGSTSLSDDPHLPGPCIWQDRSPAPY